MKQKDQLKRLKSELNSNCISLNKFLNVYYGVCLESLDNLQMTHKDVKILISNLKRISFEELFNNLKAFYSGDIILVKDYQNNIAPYTRPSLEEAMNLKCFNNIEKENDIDDFVLNDDLSVYELAVLCKRFKENKNFKEYRIANKLLKNKKGNKVKKYKKEKDNLIRSEKYEY